MNDLISRQAAIKAIEDLQDCYNGFSDTYDKACIIGVLEDLPSAQPERKEGRWMRKSNWMWTCSCCGKDDAYAYAADDACEPTVLQDFFCPNCGAKMEVKNDE